MCTAQQRQTPKLKHAVIPLDGTNKMAEQQEEDEGRTLVPKRHDPPLFGSISNLENMMLTRYKSCAKCASVLYKMFY